MKQPVRTEFLERKTYRQRRYRDGARALPAFASVLMLLPMFWSQTGGGNVPPSSLLVFIFGLWLAVALIAAILSRVILPDHTAPDAGEKD